MGTKSFSRKKAEIMLEYAMVIGVATAVMFAMNIYAKRGTQGKVKDMTDYYVSNGQQNHTSQVDDYVNTTSESKTTSSANSSSTMARGGATSLNYDDRAKMDVTSHSEDRGSSGSSNPFSPASRGRVTAPPKPTEEEVKATHEDAMDCQYLARQIHLKEADRDVALETADNLDENANDLTDAANNLTNSSYFGCPRRRGRRRCENARTTIRNSAANTHRNATVASTSADAHRATAASLNATIRNLRSQYDAQGCENLL